VVPILTETDKFESVIEDIGGGRMVELTARDSFDERLAEFLLDQVGRLELPGVLTRTIRVVPVVFPEPWRFGALVVAPPRVAKRFERESTVLQRVTYWVVPSFDGEFTDRADAAGFWHQLNRKDGWRSPLVRWDRSRKTRPVFDH
jgi:hypothetical protein